MPTPHFQLQVLNSSLRQWYPMIRQKRSVESFLEKIRSQNRSIRVSISKDWICESSSSPSQPTLKRENTGLVELSKLTIYFFLRFQNSGTGASAIYPLLGCALNPNWSFLGTDIDLESIKHSQQILDLNEAESNRPNTTPSTSNQVSSTQNQSTATSSSRGLTLKSRIELLHRSESDPLIPIKNTSSDPSRECQRREDPILYHFTMCNPPFFESEEEVQKGRETKVLDPRGVST